MPQICLKSSDGEVFKVESEILQCSTVLQDFGSTGDEEVVPLENVNSTILRKVIQWATHHKDDPQDCEGNDSWDADFLNVDQTTLFELILAANYLDIKGLLDATCKAVCDMIKGKTPEEIRRAFKITRLDDVSAEDEEQIRRENEWCEEK